MVGPKPVSLGNIGQYIRWFFTAGVLSFLSIVISGKLLAHLPCFPTSPLKGRQDIYFLTGIVNVTAHDEEVIAGLAGFISMLLVSGLCLGRVVPSLLSDRFGVKLEVFETHCVFSSFALVFVSFILKLYYAKLEKPTAGKNPDEYDELINRLADQQKRKRNG